MAKLNLICLWPGLRHRKIPISSLNGNEVPQSVFYYVVIVVIDVSSCEKQHVHISKYAMSSSYIRCPEKLDSYPGFMLCYLYIPFNSHSKTINDVIAHWAVGPVLQHK